MAGSIVQPILPVRPYPWRADSEAMRASLWRGLRLAYVPRRQGLAYARNLVNGAPAGTTSIAYIESPYGTASVTDGTFTGLLFPSPNDMPNPIINLTLFHIVYPIVPGTCFGTGGATGDAALDITYDLTNTRFTMVSGTVFNGPTNCPGSQWYMVGAIKRGTSKRLWVNGIDVGGDTSASNVKAPTDIGVHRRGTAISSRMQGYIALALLWDRGLAQAEMVRVFADPFGWLRPGAAIVAGGIPAGVLAALGSWVDD